MHPFFKLKKQLLVKARAGKITTDHGEIQTPIFYARWYGSFCKNGTSARTERRYKSPNNSRKYLPSLFKTRYEIMQEAGGLHQFMNWDKPILTDSGGYQVFSLSSSRKMTEEGVKFKSHIDGSYHFISPEKSMEIQRTNWGRYILWLLTNVHLILANTNQAKLSMELTHRWLKKMY